jgi:hypothetical protein
MQVLSAYRGEDLIAQGKSMKTAHRHSFMYQPRNGFIYVRSRMISSRTNDNFDHFPAEEIKTAYRTFIGKPVFVNHNNDNHRRARGVVVDAALHEDSNPDGSADTWVEGLMEVDAVNFPVLAKAIMAGHIDRTSMGTDVAFSVCSVCNNKASSPLEYCSHIPALKGKKIRRTTASGTKEDVLCYEKCYGLSFFENSLLVEEPADPTAFFVGGVDTRGMEMAGIKTTATRKMAAATSYTILEDPKGWHWELHITGCGDINHPKYHRSQKHSYEAPSWQDAVDSWVDEEMREMGYTSADVRVLPCAKSGQAAAPAPRNLDPSVCPGTGIPAEDYRGNQNWAHPVGVCPECGRHVGISRGSISRHKKAPPFNYGDIWSGGEGKHIVRAGSRDALCGAPGSVDGAKPIKAGPVRGTCQTCVSIWEQESSTTASRRTTASRKVAGSERGTEEYRKAYQRGWASSARTGFGALEAADSRGEPSAWYDGYHDFASDRPKWASMHFDSPEGWEAAGAPEGLSPRLTSRTATRKQGYGEVRAPAQVDTLRDEICPVCGEPDTFSGAECLVCNFTKPPEMFMDPDLEKAQQVDLRQDQGDQADEDGPVELRCDNCGNTFNDSPDHEHKGKFAAVQPWPLDPTPGPGADSLPQSRQRQVTDETGSEPSIGTNTEPAAGDTCPDCGDGILHPVEDAGPDADEAPTDEAPGAVNPFDPEAEDEVEVDPEAEVEVEVDVKTLGDTDPDAPDDEDSDEESDDDEDDDEDGDGNPFLRNKKKKAARTRRAPRRRSTSMRPALAALASQQKTIEAQARQIKALTATMRLLSQAAGVDKHPRIARLLKQADSANPAQPIEAPASEAPVQTTEDALGDVKNDQPGGGSATDDLFKPGLTSENDTSADATTTVDSNEVILDVGDGISENQDVEAPVAGTEGPRPESETKTETEVRVRDGIQTDVPFSETGWTNTSGKQGSEGRTFASMRLARLRIQSGIASGDDLTLGNTIALSQATDAQIQAEIDTLAKVRTASRPQQMVPRGLVPKRAANAQRTVPSMAPSAEPMMPQVQAVYAVSDEELAFE